MATCFVLVDREQDAIVGCYTLSAATLAATELPEDVAKRLPRYPNLPAILLGRFAVDSRYQNQGFAGRLLVDALLRALGATAQVGAVAVVVDAKDEAGASFYEHYGVRTVHRPPASTVPADGDDPAAGFGSGLRRARTEVAEEDLVGVIVGMEEDRDAGIGSFGGVEEKGPGSLWRASRGVMLSPKEIEKAASLKA